MTRSQWILLVAGLSAVILLLPLFAPHNPQTIDYSAALQSPSTQHLFGTDALGRDVLSRFLHGGQRTLTLTLLSLCIALMLGIPLGITAGYTGGWIDSLILIMINTVLAVPGLLFALIIITLSGQTPASVGLAIGLSQCAPVAQLVRTTVRSIRSEPYLTATLALGASKRYLLLRTILPNVMPAIMAYASVTFVYCLLNVAGFGYLGLIGQLELPEWGRMLNEGREVYREAIWVSLAPGFALMLLVMIANATADKFASNRAASASLPG